MPSHIEIFNSREGSSRGSAGANFNASYHVNIDEVDDDPVQYMYTQFPLGSFPPFKFTAAGGFHWAYFAILKNAVVVRRLNPKRWIVRMEYGPLPSGLITDAQEPQLAGWDFSLGSVSESVEVNTQEPFTLADGTVVVSPWGQRNYKVVDEAAASASVSIRGETIYLALASGDDTDRVANTRQKEVNGAQLTIRRDVANFNLSVGGQLAFLRGRTNSHDFLGASPGFMRFTDFQITTNQAGTPTTTLDAGPPNQLLHGISHAVSLSFLWTEDQQQPKNIHPSWQDKDTGDRYVIRQHGTPNEGKFVDDQLNEYKIFNLNDLLTMVVS